MSRASHYTGPVVLALLLGQGSAGCNPKGSGADEAAPAPVDTANQSARADSTALPTPDTSAATPPITPPSQETHRDTPPAGAAKPSNEAAGAAGGGLKLSRLEYEGWRQYSVQCARCHGQDVLPNPVAANLLISLGAGGPIDTQEKFVEVVSVGRPARGMPAFKGVMTPEQMNAMYAYVKGRAEKRIPPGRPATPPS